MTIKKIAAILTLLFLFGAGNMVLGYAVGVASFMLGSAYERGEIIPPPTSTCTITPLESVPTYNHPSIQPPVWTNEVVTNDPWLLQGRDQPTFLQ